MTLPPRASAPAATGLYRRIWAAVRRVPRGRVATYGDIARMVGGCGPRQVGYALAGLPDDRAGVPWQRIVNARGEVSARRGGDGAQRQRELLEAEGIRFDARGHLDLQRLRWHVPTPAAPATTRRRT